MFDCKDYTKSKSITIVMVVDNVDYYSEDPDDERHLEWAKEWEEAMIKCGQNFAFFCHLRFFGSYICDFYSRQDKYVAYISQDKCRSTKKRH